MLFLVTSYIGTNIIIIRFPINFLQDFHAFPDNEIFDVSDDDKENFKAFIQHFGVRDFPKIEIQDITDPLNYYDKTIKTT